MAYNSIGRNKYLMDKINRRVGGIICGMKTLPGEYLNMPKPMTPGRQPYEKSFRHQPPIASHSPSPKLDIANQVISREEKKREKKKISREQRPNKSQQITGLFAVEKPVVTNSCLLSNLMSNRTRSVYCFFSNPKEKKKEEKEENSSQC